MGAKRGIVEVYNPITHRKEGKGTLSPGTNLTNAPRQEAVRSLVASTRTLFVRATCARVSTNGAENYDRRMLGQIETNRFGSATGQAREKLRKYPKMVRQSKVANPGRTLHRAMRNVHIRAVDGLLLLWVIAVNTLYYHQFWTQFAHRIHVFFHVWHS